MGGFRKGAIHLTRVGRRHRGHGAVAWVRAGGEAARLEAAPMEKTASSSSWNGLARHAEDRPGSCVEAGFSSEQPRQRSGSLMQVSEHIPQSSGGAGQRSGRPIPLSERPMHRSEDANHPSERALHASGGRQQRARGCEGRGGVVREVESPPWEGIWRRAEEREAWMGQCGKAPECLPGWTVAGVDRLVE